MTQTGGEPLNTDIGPQKIEGPPAIPDEDLKWLEEQAIGFEQREAKLFTRVKVTGGIHSVSKMRLGLVQYGTESQPL
jgi:hypothetical protein